MPPSTLRPLPLQILFLVAPAVAVFSAKSFAALLVVAGLTTLVLEWRERRPWSLCVMFIGLAVAWMSLTAMWSPSAGNALLTSLRVGTLALLGSYLVGGAGKLDHDQSRRLARALSLGVALASTLMLAEYAGPRLITKTVNALTGQVASQDKSLANQATSVLVLFLGPALLLSARHCGNVIAACLGAITIGAVVSGDNTTAKMALTIGMVVAAMASLLPARWSTAIVRTALIGSVLAHPFAARHAVDPEQTYSRLGQERVSLVHRLVIWDFVAGKIGERPIMGWGMDSARALPGAEANVIITPAAGGASRILPVLPLHPHNAVLQVWLELGILGALGLAGLLAWGTAQLGGAALVSTRAAGLGTLAAAFVVACSSYGLWQSWWQSALWLVATLMAAGLSSPVNEAAKHAGK